MLISIFSTRSAAPALVAYLGRRHRAWSSAGASTQSQRFYPGRSDRARARVAGCVQGRAVRAVADVRAGLQPLRDLQATSRAACARRTSTPSTKCPTRAGSPTASGRGRSRPKRSPRARWSARRRIRRSGSSSEKRRRVRILASPRWTQRARPGSWNSIHQSSLKVRPRPSRLRPRSSGRSATTRSSRS